MTLKRLLLVVSILVVFGLCYARMNKNFDVLSRYPYQNEESRALIREYLDTEEIEYIIEYDIAPVYFKEYIKYDGFNIYHIEQYNALKAMGFHISDEDIVDCVETYIQNGVYEKAIALLNFYDPITLKNYYNDKIEDELVDDPTAYDTYIYKDQTLYTYVPKDLKMIAINDTEITLREKAISALEGLIIHMQEDEIDTSSIIFLDSFVDYQKQSEYHEKADSVCHSIKPGKSEHQLGLAIDIEVNEKITEWLEEKAHFHGFTYSGGHLRYTGEKQ